MKKCADCGEITEEVWATPENPIDVGPDFGCSELLLDHDVAEVICGCEESGIIFKQLSKLIHEVYEILVNKEIRSIQDHNFIVKYRKARGINVK